MSTLTINLSDEEVLALVDQLSPESRNELFYRLASRQWPAWTKIVSDAEPQARRLAAERGLDWDALSDEERLELADSLVHHGRA
jgi:hypothetical protein